MFGWLMYIRLFGSGLHMRTGRYEAVQNEYEANYSVIYVNTKTIVVGGICVVA